MPYGKWEGNIGFGTESADGVCGTVIKDWISARVINFNEVPNYGFSSGMCNSREKQKSWIKEKVVDGKIEFDLEPENCETILLNIFGTMSEGTCVGTHGQGTSTFRKTFRPRADYNFPTLWAEVCEGGTFEKVFMGLKASKAVFSCEAPNKEFALAVDFIGKAEGVGTYTGGTYIDLPPFLFSGVNYAIDGTANQDVKNFELTLDNLTKVNFTMGTSNGPRSIVPTDVDFTGKFNLFFEDEYNRNKWLGGSNAALAITCIGGTYAKSGTFASNGTAKLFLNLGNVAYTSAEFEEIDGQKGVAVAFTGKYDSAGTTGFYSQLTNRLAP